ncbi:MAG: hypothetical protein HQ522_14075 [Bacteroidetes bacterium]|nr:hypothetical protein [Bacteroidota bacterium]
MKKSSVIFLSILFVLTQGNFLHAQENELKKGFINPPIKYSMTPFWSWNGTLEKDRLLFQLNQMKEKGIDGAFMHARAGINKGGTPYFSEGWWNAVDVTVDFAAKNNFNAYLYDEDKWPSGSAGGRTLKKNRQEYIKKGLEYKKMEVHGPNSIKVQEPEDVIGIFFARILKDGEIDAETITDITRLNGKVWDVPEGEWAYTSFVQKNHTGEQIDYLDKKAVEAFIETTHEEYYLRYGEHFGSVIPGIFFDEIRATTRDKNSLVWTDDFLEKFIQIKGYDLRTKLPLLIYNNGNGALETNFDYYDVFAQLYHNAWFLTYHDWCEEHGIWVTGHTEEDYKNYHGQGDYFKTMGQLQVPGSDNEYFRYGYPRVINWIKPKQISSVAHLYGRERVMVEAMGGSGYVIPLEEYRYGFAMLGAYGVNMFVPHLFHYDFETPITKTDYPASWFYRNPYWKYFKPLADYSKRISYMISQGEHVCKVAMLYPLTEKWADGHTVKFQDKVYDELQGLLLKNHYDYDIIDPTSMAKSNATPEGLQIENESYKVLILADIKAIDKASAEKVKEFAEKGGIVLAVGSIPYFSPEGIEENKRAHHAMNELFRMNPTKIYHRMYNLDVEKKHNYHVREYNSGGKAIFTQYLWETPSILNKYVGPDIDVESSTETGLKFNHRRVGSTNFYLLVNETKTEGKYKVAFDGKGIPELWNPEDGKVQKVHNYRWKDGKTELILELNPLAATFVVLHPNNSEQTKSTLVTETDLEITSIQKDNNGVKIEGWAKSGNHSIIIDENRSELTKNWTSTNTKEEIVLDGKWDFLLSQHDLDYKWTDDISESKIELPLMQFQWSIPIIDNPNQLNNDRWKRVKVKEEYTKMMASERLLSSWDASWINYFDSSKKLVSPEVWFKKTFNLNAEVKTAIMHITADKQYELVVNGEKVVTNEEWESVETVDLKSYLKTGENILEVCVIKSEALLAQLEIISVSGEKQIIKTDESWLASIDQYSFLQAMEIASPPLGKWGNIERPDNEIKYPCQLWFSASVPTGAKSISLPKIKGDFNFFINRVKVENSIKKGELNIEPYLKDGKNEVQLSIQINNINEGLLEPLEFTCSAVPVDLASWTDYGLWWYSGRGIYKKTVNIPAGYLAENTKLKLDLGEVAYFAEIWVNGNLVKYFAWGPFEADVTEYLKEGSNNITVITANLLSNKASWNIPDDNLHDEKSRWWHDGGIRREQDKLKSGLIGPVRIVPYTLESVVVQVK